MANETPGVLATLKTYFDSMDGESDRGVALAVAAAFEEELGTILKAHMVESKETDALLSGSQSSFASRIGLCHALGLINHDERTSLTLIREIRNAFAHQWLVNSFETPGVESRCRRLLARNASRLNDAREHYMAGASELLFLMIERGRQVQRVQPGWWSRLAKESHPQ